MSEFKLTPKVLKAAGKELETILEPTDSKGKPVKIAVGRSKEMKTKIMEAGNCLTPDDALSKNLKAVLDALEIVVETPEEKEKDLEQEELAVEENDPEKELTWNDIKIMSKVDLETLCEDRNLISDSDDYEKLKDYRIDVAVELGLEVPKEKEKEEPVEVVNLNEIVKKTKKLADLKDIVTKKDVFKPLRKQLDDFTGISGTKELKAKMLEVFELEEVTKPEPKEKTKTKTPEVKKDKKEKKSKPEKKKEKIQKKNNKNTETKTDYVASLVKEGKYTLTEIIEKAEKEMNCPASSVKTMINHGKNEKHNAKYKAFNGKLIKSILVFED